MSLVQDLTPINLEEEKQKFFDKNCKYNPQFKYKKLITSNMLFRYGKPKPNYLELAKELLEKAFHNRTEADIRKIEGEIIDLKKAKAMFNEYVIKNNLQKQIEMKCSQKFISKASFISNTFKVRLPIWHRKNEFAGTLNHEIGTHAIRRINYVQQPFYKKKVQLGFREYLYTEEGLASLHTLLGRKFKIDYTGALNYLSCQKAQELSFSDLFEFVTHYLEDQNRAWYYTFRHKRGLYDTNEGGGLTKDLVYFEGLIKVWLYLKDHSFDLRSLYWGKIAYEDINKAKEMNPHFEPLLPYFYTNNTEKYQQDIT
ncbi:MAG: DUF1704 domain containing protein, partial [Microgenomates bacterium 39_7]